MTVADNSAQRSFVLLQIGRRRVAMPAGNVVELAPPVRLHAFPHTAPFISGVIVRRGRIVPVYDAGSVLTGKSSSVHRFYLIAQRQIGEGSELGAIPVNGECELVAGEMEPPAAERPAYVAGTIDVDGESVDVLSLEALVAPGAAANDARSAEARQ